MGESMKLFIYALIGALSLSLQARYERQDFGKPERRRQFTYFADDESFAVKLSPHDLRKLETIIKPHIMPNSDQDYNKRITEGLIKRIVGTCQCGEDAAMVEKVLSDFEGSTVQALFTALGLRREL